MAIMSSASTRPSAAKDLQHQAFLAVVATAQDLLHDVADVVQAQGLTEPQFNALRILRGAGPEGLPCNAIAERMITRVPDITRLVDRLERMGFAERRRDPAGDRRVVLVALTDSGRAALRALDRPVSSTHKRQFAGLSQADMRKLITLLGNIRT